MSRSTPFHKQTDANKQAGQHIYSFDREPYLKHSNAAPDVTLSDYIKRKEEGDKRITFEEWWSSEGRPSCGEYYRKSCHLVWNAALTKGKL